jgi:hypothetical protein
MRWPSQAPRTRQRSVCVVWTWRCVACTWRAPRLDAVDDTTQRRRSPRRSLVRGAPHPARATGSLRTIRRLPLVTNLRDGGCRRCGARRRRRSTPARISRRQRPTTTCYPEARGRDRRDPRRDRDLHLLDVATSTQNPRDSQTSLPIRSIQPIPRAEASVRGREVAHARPRKELKAARSAARAGTSACAAGCSRPRCRDGASSSRAPGTSQGPRRSTASRGRRARAAGSETR